MLPTLYFKQALEYRFSPKKALNFMLTEIAGDCRYPKVIGDKNRIKKCNYSFKQYLFIYKLLLTKIIETLNCILLNNQEPFVEPHKNIQFCYQLAVFMYSDIALNRKKFIFKQIAAETGFEEVPNLAGDPKSMINSWKEVRSKYLNYKGEIETLFAVNGYKEFHIPIRTKMLLEAFDEILELQRSQYSPIKVNGIQLKNNILTYKNKKIPFNKKSMRLKFVKSFYNRPTGISSKDVREKLKINLDTFKSTLKQINNKIKGAKLTIKYDKNKKVYLLTIL